MKFPLVTLIMAVFSQVEVIPVNLISELDAKI